jgi:hypothetical protein
MHSTFVASPLPTLRADYTGVNIITPLATMCRRRDDGHQPRADSHSFV